MYDSDGLLSHHNGVQRRLVSIFAAHKKQVNHLKRDLYLTRMALCRLKLAHHNHHRPNQPNPSILSNGNVDGHSVMANGGHRAGNVNGLLMAGNGGIRGSQSGGCNSSVQSDASSWEAVDEKEAKPTLWVPDHAVSSCKRCRTQFWFGRRKHHCRNCGQLFCSECSENLAPIPSEQLYHPVRICDDCFQKLYPEEAAKKALNAMEIDMVKSEVIETHSYQEQDMNDLTHHPNGAIVPTSEHKLLANLSEMSNNKPEKVNENVQQNCCSVFNSSDSKNVVTKEIDDEKKESMLEGEACVVLNPDNQS